MATAGRVGPVLLLLFTQRLQSLELLSILSVFWLSVCSSVGPLSSHYLLLYHSFTVCDLGAVKSKHFLKFLFFFFTSPRYALTVPAASSSGDLQAYLSYMVVCQDVKNTYLICQRGATISHSFEPIS